MKTCKVRQHSYEPIKGTDIGCPQCSKINKAEWRVKNKAYMKEYYRSNKLAYQTRMSKWRAENLAAQAKYSAARKAKELQATPNWLTQEQIEEIKQFYVLAKELSWLSESPLEVDHIIPLQGKNVRGLHVPWNLQLLPESLNCSKGNRV